MEEVIIINDAFSDDANTNVFRTNAVYIDEGQSVNVSCNSTGIPTPNITWTFNNQTTSFTQTDVYTDINVTITGESAVEVTQGNVVSTLHIVNLQYPSTTGDYVCSGSSNRAGATSSSAIITVNTSKYLPIINFIGSAHIKFSIQN